MFVGCAPMKTQFAFISVILLSLSFPLMALELDLDKDHAVTAVIGSSGGEIRTTDSKGQSYTLSIPANALSNDVSICLTPILGESGIPLSDGVLAAAHLQPEGLRLLQPAILTIEMAQALPIPNEIPFAYRLSSGEYRAQSMMVVGTIATFPLMHFSGYGVGQGTTADWAMVRSQVARDTAETLLHDVAVVLKNNTDGTYGPYEYQAALLDIFNRLEAGPYADLVNSLGTGPNCTAERSRIFQINWISRQATLLGAEWPDPDYKKIELIYARCTNVLEKLCSDNHDPALMNNLLAHSHKAAVMGMHNVAKDAQDAARRCGTFMVVFNSKIDMLGPLPGWTRVVSRFLTSWLDELFLGNEGENRPQATEGTGAYKAPGTCSASWTITPEKVVFNQLQVNYQSRSGEGDYDAPFEQASGDITDFNLRYSPGLSNENLYFHCPRVPPILVANQIWTPGFFPFHVNERRADGLLRARNFTMHPLGQALVAEKIYKNSNANTSEETKIEIFHNPGAK